MFYNAEHYPDPTAGAALAKIGRAELRRYRWNWREIAQLEAQLDQIRVEVLSSRTPQFTDIPPTWTGGDSDVERAVIRYADMEALYYRKRDALLAE